jgi:TP53 regulating kinase-like protein
LAALKRTVLIKKGAEASLYLAEWHGRKVVMKKRLPKEYRPSQLDLQIRNYRTVHEPQLMHEAKEAGVPTPLIYLVDVEHATIIMEHVDGKQIKQLLGEVSERERQRLCFKVGCLIGLLHKHGIVHGDLTTSNMILDGDGNVYFVDFGLGEKTAELEARAVDLHLMKRALQSTHFEFADECMRSVVEGYASTVGAESSKKVAEKIGEIERRGRYVAERKEEHD